MNVSNFLKKKFVNLKVLLMNLPSVERETSGGGMTVHRLLFGIDEDVLDLDSGTNSPTGKGRKMPTSR